MSLAQDFVNAILPADHHDGRAPPYLFLSPAIRRLA
jgi:hypothetical protein